jgi:hypothetical protein
MRGNFVEKKGVALGARSSRAGLTAVGVLALLIVGCTISDADRCGKGLIWDDKVKGCLEEIPDTESATDTETDTETDTATETDTENDDAGNQSTFGTPCFSNEVCTGEVDFCQLNVLTPDDPGLCTVDNCVPADCPDAFQCCDCSIFGQNITCIPDDAALQATGFGCTCG